jgi:hypothetical protein
MASPPLAPLVVGVTGHRDLRQEDLSELQNAVGRILDEHCSPATPLMLLSPLAEGADRLVAQVALDRGARLVVILPMEKTLYEKDFEKQESLDKFRELLGKAETIIALPHVSRTEEIEKKGSPARNLQYALVGACVARHSHFLLALWDGEHEAGTGGTAQIVKFQRSGRFEEDDLQRAFERLQEPFGPGSDPLAAPEPGLVVHVVTPHEKRPTPCGSFKDIRLAPECVADQPFLEAFNATQDRLNSFNRDLKRHWENTADSRQKARKELFAEDKSAELSEALLTLREQQAGADVLASHFQQRTRHTVCLLSALVFVASVAFAYHSTLAPPGARMNPWSLALYLVLLAVAAGVHALAERWNLHNKFLDYRAVAEGLRVQFYWSLAGLGKSSADHYLRWQRSELEWIRHVLRPWSLELASPPTPIPFQQIKKHWIGAQARYFKQRAPEKRHQLLKLTSIRNVLLLSSLGIAVFEVFHQPGSRPWVQVVVLIASCAAAALLSRNLYDLWRDLRWQPTHWEAYGDLTLGALWAILGLLVTGDLLLKIRSWHIEENLLDRAPDAWRMVVMGLAAVAAALVYGYAETMALSDESKQYGRMERIFGSALEKDIGPTLLEALGKEALAENGEWVLMHRERPIERPT